MTKFIKTVLILFVFSVIIVPVYAQQNRCVDIPQLKNIQIDSDSRDWPDDAFQVQLLANPDGQFKHPDDFDVKVKLGWDKKGLLVLVTVQDDKIVEHPDAMKYWSYDSFNLIMTPSKSSAEIIQLNVSPGASANYPELRYYVFDDRVELKKSPVKIEANRKKTQAGYLLEMRLPWESLSIVPKMGSKFALQMYATDSDSKQNGFHIPWYPKFGAQENPSLMYEVCLSKKASRFENIIATAKIKKMRQREISIIADESFNGSSIRIFNANGTVAESTLALNQGRVSSKILIPFPKLGETDQPLKAEIAGKHVVSIKGPNINKIRAEEFIKAELKFENWIFNTPSFPKCDFEKSYYMEDLVGPYSIETKFYNQHFDEVTKAEKDGRYGAIVKVIPKYGQPLLRFFNLYKYPQNFQWWNAKIDSPQKLFGGLGLDSSLVRSQADIIAEFCSWRLMQDFNNESMGSLLLANLSNTSADSEKQSFRKLMTKDKEWWLQLKRKYYGHDAKYSTSFACPKIDSELNATVLREGTPVEAGIKRGNVSKVDSICKVWAADTDQAFSVLLAKDGVIYFHNAYGSRNGKPMTIDTQSWMASITKLLSGTLMMMMVDQGYVNLDDPVEKFLPTFENAATEKKLTVRNLYNHTNGLLYGYGDNNNDLEGIIGALYPHLNIGEEYQYNGCGFGLGGKIIEIISGETIPDFYKKHLLDPLNCKSTKVWGTAGDANSTTMDMAKIAQMLLNKGAYGNKRFFSEETFQQMLPINLSKQIGKNTIRSYGVGTKLFDREGFGKGTFGHTAASFATLRIDPENKLIVIMNRNRGGSNFEKYHPQFIDAVIEGVK
ncbi:hypothetical protein EMN47_11470 [Prolixibacteraceae bacterium JC049]|nr:hypothetical protein [Prolixibacteraceae bacterium JC049]